MAIDFTMTRTVTFAETDLAGVMHFANYFRVMEEVEHAFWRSLGLNVVMPDGDAHISWPRKSVACEYHRPVHFEDTLECHLQVTKVGERSVEYEIRFLRDDRPVATAKATIVCCKVKPGKFESIPLPAAIRAKLEAKS